jgi:hypothetical protein
MNFALTVRFAPDIAAASTPSRDTRGAAQQ